MARIDGRTYKDLRPVEIIPGVNKFAEGSCLIRCGNTHVLCTASVEERVPPHVPYGEGWVTAEYYMLPSANRERSRRDVSKGNLSPRSAEIQRLVGRALRASIDMKALGERTITIDCDVLQGDGGTRTASVTGGYVALALACQWLVKEGYLLRSPLRTAVAAVSAGIVDDELLLDLCYEEDSNAQVDLNCIMTEQGELVEIQGTGEGRAFTMKRLIATNASIIRMLTLIAVSLLRTVESIATPCSVKAYERTVECFKLLNRSQFVTSSFISSLVS